MRRLIDNYMKILTWTNSISSFTDGSLWMAVLFLGKLPIRSSYGKFFFFEKIRYEKIKKPRGISRVLFSGRGFIARSGICSGSGSAPTVGWCYFLVSCVTISTSSPSLDRLPPNIFIIEAPDRARLFPSGTIPPVSGCRDRLTDSSPPLKKKKLRLYLAWK